MDKSLEELEKVVDQTRQRYEALGMANTFGLTTEKRIMLDINYRQAQKEFNQAMSDYYNAMQNHMARNTGGFNDA